MKRAGNALQRSLQSLDPHFTKPTPPQCYNQPEIKIPKTFVNCNNKLDTLR